MTATTALSDRELIALLERMQERFAWPQLAGSFAVAKRWASKTASFYRCQQPGNSTPDVVIKIGNEWTGQTARWVYEEMGRLHRLLAQRVRPRVGFPEPLGWSDAPPAVAMAHIGGTSLFHALSDPSHRLWRSGLDEIRPLISRCGETLGAYHAAGMASLSPANEEATSQARDDLRRAARRTLSAHVVGRRGQELSVARCYALSPNDFLVSNDAELSLVDPPNVRKFAAVQKDISAFTFHLQQFLARQRGHTSSGRRREALRSLREAFLEGYASTGPLDPRVPENVWGLLLYEGSRAAGTANKLLRERRYGRVLRYLRWAAGRRLRLSFMLPRATPD